ncbi:MAG: sensor histidine kinase KdpD [Actinobacteria bacterium]|nr:sensor histidine kinase KdpD [Actinomycetota bacterium]
MSRGRLRIYLGAAPGVGKTFAMLNEGRRRHERGTAIVVGYVETHGRPRTAEQLGDLEVVPRATVPYRDQEFEEMDVAAVLARRPEVALVDELAHTNVPGSRNEKRWQDVQELLDAGIDVISTVNIQHLESLNDVVEGITGIRQRETVPDAVVRAAEQIELVDSTPEALRRRMAHGNIYGPDKVDTALAHYFRPGNLAALRELALLWVADRVDESLHEYRERHGIAAPWETRERVAVALTGAPGGDGLIRRAARIAARSKADLIGIHVWSDDGLVGQPTDALGEHRHLLEELGGAYREVVGSDVPRALVQTARAEGATQLVLGASRRSRWIELTRGSVIAGVIRQSGRALDVHVISTEEDKSTAARRSTPHVRLTPLPRRRQAAGFALAALGLPLLTAALVPARASLGFASVGFLYLLAVIAVATVGGVWCSVVAAVAGFGLLNWFFADPVNSFTISKTRDVVALVAFLVVAIVVSALVGVAARRTAEAARARTEAEALAAMAGSLLREGDPVPELLSNLVSLFRLDHASVVSTSPTLEVLAEAGPDPNAGDATMTMPLGGGIELRVTGGDLATPDRRVIGAFADQLAVALESRRLQAEAAAAAALAQANELRSGLLAAVSHDLRTPLASIKTASSSLLSDDITFPEAERRDLLETVEAEADRLNDLVGNLLDMSRLQAGAVAVQVQPVGLEDVIGGALSGLPDRGHAIRIDVPETLPRVRADPALLERAVANLVDNALAYSRPRDAIRIEAGVIGNRVDLRIIDTGPGIPVVQRDDVLRPFQRLGDSPNGSGVGLGLAVANGFVTAMDGELLIEDTPGGGTTMVIDLPVA